MRVEPWQVMGILSVLIVIVGMVLHLDVASPSRLIFYVVLLVGTLVSMYFGYRLGNVLSERRE